MNVQSTLEIPAPHRAPGAISVALVLVLAGAALFAIQSCVDPPAKPTAPTAPTTATPPPPPTPNPLPPPPT